LIINPEDRITMKEAMTDPWILEGFLFYLFISYYQNKKS